MTKKSPSVISTPSPRTLRFAEREAELERELQRVRAKRMEEEAEASLQSHKDFQQISRDLQKARRKLTLQRVGRARKRDSIKAMQRRIETRELQIAQHDQAEAVLEQEIANIQARVDALRKQLLQDLSATDLSP
jgi:hypothetical protein